MANLKKNFIYQTAYQVLATALPLVTSPYISRVIGSSGLGVYSYTSSVATYFMLFAMLGVNNYGSRSIALVKHDRKELSRVFCEIYTLQCILTLIATSGYLFYFFVFNVENPLIAILQIITIVNCFLDINWLYFGLEKIKITVTRNVAVKLFTLIGIFTFVHSTDDLWVYTLIMVSSTLVSEIVLFWNLGENVNFVRVKWSNVFHHFKPDFLLYIPILALSIYHYMDKTMLGALSTYEQTGYYYNVDKIINIPMGIINGMGTVMLPRATILAQDHDISQMVKLFRKSFELVFFLASAIVFGILSISKEFTPWFFGKEYMPCVNLLNVLTFVAYFKAISQTIRTQYLIPKMKNKEYIRAICTGAVINFVLNYILILKIGAMGAVVATLVSEAIVCIWHLYDARKELPVISLLLSNWFYVLAGIVMCFAVRGFADLNLIRNNTIQVVAEIMLSVTIYMVLCLAYWFITKQGIFYETIKGKLKRN